MNAKFIYISLFFIAIIAIGGLTANAQNDNGKPSNRKPGNLANRPKGMGFGLPLFVKVTKLNKTGFTGTILAKERIEKIMGQGKPENTERIGKLIERLEGIGPLTFVFNETTNQNAKHDTLNRNQIKVGQSVAVTIMPENLKGLMQSEEKTLPIQTVSTVDSLVNSIKQGLKDRVGKDGPMAKFGFPVPVRIVSISNKQATVKAISRDDLMPEPKDRPGKAEDNEKRAERRAEMDKKIAALGNFKITLPTNDKVLINGKPNGTLKAGMNAVAMLDPKEFKAIVDGSGDVVTAKAIMDIESFKQLGKKMKDGIKDRIKNKVGDRTPRE